jgi:hypothetical protein
MVEETFVCEGCGCVVAERLRQTHHIYESVLTSHGWAIAVLQIAHIAPHVHDRYDVRERIQSKHFDNWTDGMHDRLKAFAEALPDEVES